jgi:hypothetical protein
MPTPDNIEEPTDVKLKGIEVTNEFLRRDYEEVLKLLRLHEQELALIWLLNCAIIVAMIYRGRKIEQTLKELYDFGK